MNQTKTKRQVFTCKTKCKDYSTCQDPCDIVDLLANNNKSRKEKLIEYNDGILTKDYKEVICRMRTSKEFLLAKNIEQIRELPAQHHKDIRRKAIAAMLYADMSVKEICVALGGVSNQWIYQIING